MDQIPAKHVLLTIRANRIDYLTTATLGYSSLYGSKT
jgi:hypothetical protein